MADNAPQRVLRPADQRKRRSHYVAALDGLRAFAVLAVIFYHMGLGWAPGGLMGVTVFFVISGYLINGLLVAEYESTGVISLPQFWLRRVRRIIPAVLLALAGTLVLCALVSPTLFAKARQDLLPSLLFFNNWWQIFHNVSYFEAAAAPSPLTHYWSLAIEEQFYIVWPLLLLLMLKLRVPKKGIAAIVGLFAVLSIGEMALMYSPASDPSRIYYGTDTRASSLLIGAFLALVWPSTIFGHRRKQSDNATARKALNIVGAASLAALVVVVVTTSSYTPFPYRGGIALVSILTALLISVLVVPNTWVARLMQLKPLVWIGKRSYGMYLWHYPIILATSRITSTVEVPWWVRIAQIVIIFAISDLSFRFVETPIRSGALRRWWQNRKSSAVDKAKAHEVPSSAKPAEKRRAPKRVGTIVTTVTCAALACAAAVALAVMPPATSSVPLTSTSLPSASTAASPKSDESVTSDSAANSASSASASSSVAAGPASPASSTSADSSEASDSASSTSSKSASSSSESAASAESSEASSSASTSSESSSAASGSAPASSADPSGSASASSVAASSASPSSETSSAPTPGSSNAETSSGAAASSDATVSSSAAASSDAAASSSAASEPEASRGVTQTVDAAIAKQVENLTDEERAQAEKALMGVVERAITAVDAEIEETIKENERKRRQGIYDELFNTEHLNSSGALIFDPLLIGDSVAAGCENEFYRAFPYGHSDAVVNRNVWESPYLFYSENNQVGEYIVFCLGTNNAVVDEQIDEMLGIVGEDKKVILVNIRCPRDWEAQTNEAIAKAPERYSNVVAIVDWYNASAGHDEYFYEDGIHVNGVGAKAYIDLIQQTIEQTIK